MKPDCIQSFEDYLENIGDNLDRESLIYVESLRQTMYESYENKVAQGISASEAEKHVLHEIQKIVQSPKNPTILNDESEIKTSFAFWSSVGLVYGMTSFALPIVLTDVAPMYILLGIILLSASFYWLFKGDISWTQYKAKHLQKIRNAILTTLIPIAGILFLFTSYFNSGVNYLLTVYLVLLLGMYLACYMLINKRLQTIRIN